MTETALDLFVARVRDSWGTLSCELIANCSTHLAELLRAPATDQWRADLIHELPESRELYRDPVHGFVLLAHTETKNRYRVPHDHGSSWVIYGVLQGEMEMSTYSRLDDAECGVRLIKRGSTLVRPGEVQVYLPGDIHDTRCVSAPAIQFRFTSRDLRQETTMIRYAERGGVWVPGA
ncbi:hypothetical protein [Parasphingorhabdus sp.]|uniref:hypothetical protein n=1 Tax=Parasphingorhabdus sp. TaxID=2709688 RepID=UPI0032EEEEAB